ncbi:MAG: trehalose-phosphatase [Archangium sp.]|nr:trehalose-phosphatase [Archangium sp.]
MNDLLTAAQAGVLRQVAWSRVLVAFDFDGTLAPIVERHDAAQLRPATAKLLREVCERYPCAVISGRSRADVERRLAGVPVRAVVGNHGLEPGLYQSRFAKAAAALRPRLERALAPFAGVEVEDKRYSLAVHYRRSRKKREARAAIYAAVEALGGSQRIIPGKLVVNVLPGDAPHKGDALLRLRNEMKADTAIYVGDDITDEDVFQLDEPGRLVSVRVGRSRSSAAEYFVRDQRAVDTLLRRLVLLRQASAHA